MMLKFIAPPYVDVVVRGTAFKITAVVVPGVHASSRSKFKSYYLGLTRAGTLRGGSTLRFSKEEWSSVDEAYKAWWQGFTLDNEFSDANAVAKQLIEDGSAVAV